MRIITILWLWSIGFVVSGQCPVGRVELRTQTDVDRFGIDWPHCQEINGSVEIGYPKVTPPLELEPICTTESDITNLRGLRNIRRITRDLIINCVPDLGSLRGLDNLEVVERVFDIYAMPDLRDFTGLERFKAQNGNFNINAPNLENFTGLDSMRKAVNFRIDTKKFLNFSGLTSLKEVFRLSVAGPTLFQNFDSLQIVPSFGFRSNDTIKHFNFLEKFSIEAIDYIGIQSSPNLKIVSLPKSLTRVNSLFLSNLPNIEGLNGFNNLIETERLRIVGLTRLKNLSGLENLKTDLRRTINDGIGIQEMDSLLSLDGIKLEEVKSRITIRENPVVQDISAIEGINF